MTEGDSLKLSGFHRCLWIGMLVLACIAIDLRAQGAPPAMVRVGEVRNEELIAHWEVVGRLREVRHATVAAEQEGRVVKVPIEDGDTIVGGETVLAQIDDIWAKIRVTRAEADIAAAKGRVAEAKAKLEQAKRDLSYYKQLKEQGTARIKEFEDAQTEVTTQEAALETAEAELLVAETDLDMANEELKRHAVIAPFDGIVVNKMTEVGQWVGSGATVAEVISTGPIDAVVDVPERYINQLQKDGQIQVVINALDEEMLGKVVAVIPSGAERARTFPVKIRLDNNDNTLKAGMSVTARVPTGQKAMTLTVPRDAVLRESTGAKVWLNLNGSAMSVGVKILFGVGDRYAIQPMNGGPPVKPGMQVVVEGAERLFPTRPLQIVGDGKQASSQ